MKFFSLILSLALFAVSMVFALPLSDPNVKCQINCDVQDFKPVCGTDDAGETRTFQNLCILKTENCLRTLTFQKTSDKPCP